MNDFKHLHPSNQPTKANQPSTLEYIGYVAVLCAISAVVVCVGIFSQTGGF